MDLKSHWTEMYFHTDSLALIEELSLGHALEGGHEGSKIALLIQARDYPTLCRYELSLDCEWRVDHLISCRQALAFYSKNASLDIGVNRRQVALDSFVASELACEMSNRLFYGHLSGSVSFLPGDCRILYAVRRKIESVLGRAPRLSELRLKFGPGATTDVKKVDACPSNKMAAGLACSESLLHSGLLPELLREVPHWYSSLFGVVSDEVGPVRCTVGNLSFVPKNAKTDRAIVTEPVLNSFLQLGIGEWIARRLKRHGVDIRDQGRNAGLAREGSLTNELATLDLSSASDCVSKGLVKFLLPPAWYYLLASARTPTVKVGKQLIQLNKFSSMGNGFTFPLETLIFWAISFVLCGSSNTNAYGDDIICPSSCADEVCRVLRLCGFAINTGKSFITGPFRESCGHDYYRGIETRPWYARDGLSAETLFGLHNFYVRNFQPDRAAAVRRCIHPSLHLYGPDNYGDGHLIGEHPRTLKDKLRAKGYGGYTFDTFTHKPRFRNARYAGDYVSPLYSVYAKECLDPYSSSERIRAWIQMDTATAVKDFLRPVRGERFSRENFPLWPLPGSSGVKRVSIYTFG